MSILKDVLVLDFSQGYSGDFCTMQLADFGARVIKIERKGIGDMVGSRCKMDKVVTLRC